MSESVLELGPLTLECGVQLPNVALALSDLGPADAPVVLVIHALTGDHRPQQWWSGVVGPGREVDTERFRTLCFNNLGSCYGSTGPRTQGFPRLAQVPGVRAPAGTQGLPPTDEDWLPAPITPWDQARALLLALDRLGVARLELCAGGSLGGMIALCLGVLAPERIGRLLVLAAQERTSPWVMGWNHVGRQCILADHEHGLERARQLAHLSYRANPGLELRQGRAQTCADWSAVQPYKLQTYLQHQGRKLAARFDPRAYLCQLDAMDHHDIERRPPRDPGESWTPTEPWGLARLPHTHLVGIDTDQLFPAAAVQALAARIPGAVYHELASPHGHDAFLLEWDQLGPIFARVLGGTTP